MCTRETLSYVGRRDASCWFYPCAYFSLAIFKSEVVKLKCLHEVVQQASTGHLATELLYRTFCEIRPFAFWQKVRNDDKQIEMFVCQI